MKRNDAMPRQDTVTTTVYTYAELSDEAKEKARDRYRENNLDYEWWDSVYEDAVTMAALMGIEIDTRRDGKGPAISFSGFSSQGDGACFDGTYRYRKGALKALEAAAPTGHQDEATGEWVFHNSNIKLQLICRDLQLIQRPFLYKLQATVKQRGHYYHSGCTHIEVTHADDPYRDIGDAEDGIAQALRDFMDWIYARLEAEYDALNSDEAIEDSIEANNCEFREDGTQY
jgi:hypothetical protein